MKPPSEMTVVSELLPLLLLDALESVTFSTLSTTSSIVLPRRDAPRVIRLAPVVHHHVDRLQVAVDHPAGVGRLHGQGDGADQPGGLRRGQRPARGVRGSGRT